MGSSKERKPRGEPDYAQPSGVDDQTVEAEVEGEGQGAPGQEEKEALTLRLVQLNEQVVNQTSKGDRVTVQDTGGTLQVHTSQGRIGNVPPTRAPEVRGQGLTAGMIQEIQNSPPQVLVILTG